MESLEQQQLVSYTLAFGGLSLVILNASNYVSLALT